MKELLPFHPKRITLHDDVIFYLTFSKKASNSFIKLLCSKLDVSQVKPDTVRISEFPALIAGDVELWKTWVYPEIDHNPIMMAFFQDPIDYALEIYWQHAVPAGNGKLDGVEELPSPKLTLEEFFSAPGNIALVNNPQWNTILSLCEVWRPDLSINLSKTAQWKLVKERIEQMTFFGLLEKKFLSLDLLLFTFRKKIVQSYEIDDDFLPPYKDAKVRKEIVTPHVLQTLYEKLALDIQLYAYVEELFFVRYRQMMYKMSECFTGVNDSKSIERKVDIKEYPSVIKRKLVWLFQRGKRLLFHCGSK